MTNEYIQALRYRFEKIRKFILGLLVSMGMVSIIQAQALAQNATTMPLYGQLQRYGSGEFKPTTAEMHQICLLSMKTYQYAANKLGLAKPESKKAKRAEKVAPILQNFLFEDMQTKTNFDRSISEIKKELALFKAADSKKQKTLFKIAKSTNKRCGKNIAKLDFEELPNWHRIAELMPPVSSNTAMLCHAVTLKSGGTDTSSGYINTLIQLVVWDEVYKKEKRREGFPDDKIVPSLKLKENIKALQEIPKEKALKLYEDCPAMYKKAKFAQSLDKSNNPINPKSAVKWD